MNLVGRFVLLIIRLLIRRPTDDPLAPVTQCYRVWPHDMDLNFHLTAARYFSFGDLGRIQWLIDSGLGRSFLKGRYRAVLNAQELSYVREFPPFSQVNLEVQLRCWDEKYAYFEQRFYLGKTLHSVGHARMAMLHRGKVMGLDEVLKREGRTIASPPETEAIRDWKETLFVKREQFS